MLKASIGVPSNLAEKIVYDFKDCPKKGPEPECPPRKWKYPVIDERIDVSRLIDVVLTAFTPFLFASSGQQVPPCACENSRM